jgi:hypothetical protein
MFAYSVWMNKMFEVLRYGCVVGVREALDDYDYETEQYVVCYTNDRQFRVVGGKVYCNGGSVLFPRPVTDSDGWEVEPIEDPFAFFEDLLDNGNVQEVYVSHEAGKKHTVWNCNDGWSSGRAILECVIPPAFVNNKCCTEKETTCCKALMPLKVLAGLVSLEVVGPMALKEFEYCFDTETINSVLKPVAWWVAI